MKNRFLSKLAIVLLGVGLAAAFTSCENFLKGANVKEELDKSIAYANAKACTIYISQDTQMGSFLSSGDKECRVGFSIDVVFNLNKEYYSFNSLKAVSIKNKNQSMNDYVRFTLNQNESNPEKGMYTVTITLLKESNDILILPDCTSFLRVVSYSPSFIDLNSPGVPIIVEFSIPVDPESINENFFILINGEDITKYLFETPILSDNNTLLTIYPKSQTLRKYIKNSNSNLIEAKVGLSDKIISSKNEYHLIQDANTTFSVRYDATSEEVPPEERDFFITRHPISLNSYSTIENSEKFNYEDLAVPPVDFDQNDEDQYEEYCTKVLQNRTGGTIYIYGKYYDSGSGVNGVVVEEKLTNDFFSKPVANYRRSVRYTADSPEAEFETINGETRFCIKHNIETDDGAVRIFVSVKDAAGNSPKTSIVTAFKKSKVVISENHKFGTYKSYQLMNNLNNKSISVDEYNASLKTITQSLYLNDTIDDRDILVLYWFDFSVQEDYESENGNVFGVFLKPKEMICEYKNNYNQGKNETITLYKDYPSDDEFFGASEFECSYYGTLINIGSVEGVELNITISDDLGNSAKKTIRMPKSTDVKRTISKSSDSQANVKFYSNYRQDLYKGVQIEYNTDGSIKQIKNIADPEGGGIDINSGYKYKATFLIDGYGGFCTEINNSFYTINSQSDIITGDIQLSGEPDIKMSQNTLVYGSEIKRCLDVIIPLTEETANKYDYIQINYRFNRGNYHPNLTINYPKGTTMTIGSCPTEWFYSTTSFKAYITGFSETYGASNTLEVSLPTYTPVVDKDHDNVPPDVTLDFPFGETLYISATDDVYDDVNYFGSGLKSFEYEYGNSGKLIVQPNSSGKVKLSLPLYDILENNKYEYVFSYKAIDNATIGNVNEGELYFYYYDFPEGDFVLSEKGSSSYTIITNKFTEPEILTKSDIKIFQYEKVNDTTGKWVPYTSSYSPRNISTSDGYYNQVILSNNDVCKYVKIISTKDDKYSIPGYFYIGSKLTYGLKNKLQSTGFNDSIDVVSDAPVFVHTIVTKEPLNECRDWTVKEWEFYKKHLGERVLDFSSSDTAVQTYSIPVRFIEKGECYVVIAHYGYNKVAKSSVFVKE
ncbi:MAG: hypothetical protein IK102_04725 [Treponema sp.]|nr:hypothetical protein [Treponema sp.]